MLKKLLAPHNLKWLFIAAVTIAWAAIFIEVYQNGRINWGEAVHETGELAWNLLLFMIFVSLGQKIVALHWPKFPWLARLLPLRKWAGVFAFLVALSHGASEIAKRGFSLDNIINTAFSTHHAAIFGTIAFLIMLPLFLTSTHWAVKTMGPKLWKNLQRFAHVAFIFAAVHVSLIEYFGRGKIEFGPLVLLGLYAAGYAYLFTVKKLRKNKK